MNTESTLSMKDHPLKTYIDAVRDDEPETGLADGAQRRLMNRLDESPGNKPAKVAPWGWATAAALAILVVPLLVMMPGSNGSLAFAEVQSFFTDFRTMHARLTTSVNGNEVMAMEIVVDDQDRARIDSGEAFSFIVDPNEQVMLQLFHQAGRAVRVPLNDDGAQEETTGLDWLSEIREYQGQARLIEETRRIDGSEVFGFRLTERAIDMTLWATESGRPVLLEMHTGREAMPATTRIRFDFDQPVDAERFSLDVPAGYSVETRPEDG
jgi:hypothetical protein